MIPLAFSSLNHDLEIIFYSSLHDIIADSLLTVDYTFNNILLTFIGALLTLSRSSSIILANF